MLTRAFDGLIELLQRKRTAEDWVEDIETNCRPAAADCLEDLYDEVTN